MKNARAGSTSVHTGDRRRPSVAVGIVTVPVSVVVPAGVAVDMTGSFGSSVTDTWTDVHLGPNWATDHRPVLDARDVSTWKRAEERCEGAHMSPAPDGPTDRKPSDDREAFEQRVAPHRHELLVHCYRILGSLQDAEEVLQETLLSAWQGLPSFEGRSSLRTWLYRIATNRCLDLLRAARRRPEVITPLRIEPPEPSSRSEVAWLQPFPDDLMDTAPTPEQQVETAGGHLAGLRPGVAAAARPATRGAAAARRPGLPGGRGRRPCWT